MKTRKLYLSLGTLTSLIVLAAIYSFSTASLEEGQGFNPSEEKVNNFLAKKRTVSAEAKAFWYDGKAELSSYKLTQARYGETHEGTAVLVYVTEPFSKSANTKADQDHSSNIPVLKLNKTLKFNTGIYPYSLMSSTFFPLENENSSLKMSSSLQEWCGMTYFEMKNEPQAFTFDFDSYFEGFTFQNKSIKKTVLEDDLWSLIRLNPELLPQGKQAIIPSMFFLRLRNKTPQAYQATLTLEEGTDGISHYQLTYPELERTLVIHFNTAFPHAIVGWEDTHFSGYGAERKIQTSKAELLKSIKTDYWNQNHKKDTHWRNKLAL